MNQVEKWKFESYEKIPETSKDWPSDAKVVRFLEKSEWVVTEKIHGANFCWVTNGKELRCAKRKSFLGVEEEFFQHQQLKERLTAKIFALYQLVARVSPQCQRISIYGELFGGGYPHPSVKLDPLVQLVQSGIYYSPTIEFCAFDLVVEEGNERRYVDYDEGIKFFEELGIFYAKPLFIGRYQKAMEFPIEFQSTIPARLGLPPLEEDNKAEGVVIKPLKTIYLTGKKGLFRPILKRKIPRFSEEKRYNQAEKWAIRPATIKAESQFETLKWEAYNFITENRLRNAISKVGYTKRGEPSKSRILFNMVVEDIWEQLAVVKEAQGIDSFSLVDEKKLSDYIAQEVGGLLKGYFKKETRRV